MNDEIKLKHLANRLLDLYVNGTPDSKLGKILNRHIDEDSFFYSSPFADFSDFLIESELGDRELLEEMWESIEEFLVRMFDYEEKIFREKWEAAQDRDGFERTVLSVSDTPRFDVTELAHNLRDRNRFLENIIELFDSNRSLLNLVVMNGSLGTNDYKPGWSDVDIFCNLSREAISSEENLKKARKLIRKVNREIYTYNVLQLHGVFLSTELDLLFHTDTLFPRIPCFEYGKIIYSKRDEYTLHAPATTTTTNTTTTAAAAASAPDGVRSALAQSAMEIHRLASGILNGSGGNGPSLKDKVLLFHRIYAFPFTFLHGLGVRKYKKESFDYLVENYSHLFPDIEKFYREMNSCYSDWNISKLRTLGTRNLLLRRFHPHLVNGLLVRFEKEIRCEVDRMYDRFGNWHRERFQEYLETAREYLENNRLSPEKVDKK